MRGLMIGLAFSGSCGEEAGGIHGIYICRRSLVRVLVGGPKPLVGVAPPFKARCLR
jgi:hypothetical protein